MAVTSSIRGERRRARSGLGEAIVLASMGTVSAVVAAVLVLQLGTPVWVAASVAAMFLAAVLAAHVLVRRSEQLAVLEREMAGLDERLGRVMAAGPRLEMPPPRSAAPAQRSEAPPQRSAAPAQRSEAPPQRSAAPAQRSEAPHARPATMPGPLGGPVLVSVSSPPQAAPMQSPMRSEGPAAPTSPSLSAPTSAPTLRASAPLAATQTTGVRIEPTAGVATSAHVIDQHATEAASPAPRLEVPRAAMASDESGAEPTPAASRALLSAVAVASPTVEAGPSIEALLAVTAPRPPIDDLLKRLAGDISAGAALRDVRTVPDAVAMDDRPEVAEAQPSVPEPAPWLDAESAFEEPLADLAEFAHETVAQADVLAAESPESIAAQGKVAAIVDALSNERIDLFLEPIIGFETLAAEHYDVTVRLRQADGAPLDQADYAEAARGTGLLALIDTVKIARTKRLVTETMADGRERVLNVLDAETLSSEQFHEDVADLTGADRTLAGRLVLTFRQSDVRGFAPVEWQALARLSAIGFRFGVDAITDLDMDFGELAAGGFTFARLDADVFLDGLMVAGAERVSPADVCRHLTENGLGLVVRRIDDPKRLARVMGFGVMMGQGAMFGPPRLAGGDGGAKPRLDA